MPEFIPQQSQQQVPQSGDFRTSKIPSVNKVMSSSNEDPALAALMRVYNRPDIKAQAYTNPVFTENLNDSNAKYAYYAPELGYSPLDFGNEQRYEARQSIWDSAKNRAIKIGANALTGLYSGFAATSDFLSGGGTEGITSNEGINNLNKFTEDLRNRYPNFKNAFDEKYYLNTHLVGETLESLGFTVGAIGSSLLIDAVIAPLTEGVGSALLLPRQLAMATSKWGKLSNALVEGGKNYKTLLSSLDEAGELTAGVAKALKNYDRFTKVSNGVRFGMNVSVSALGESAIEANQTSREIRKNLMDQTVDEYGNYNGGEELLKRIDNTAKEGGANTILPNFMFLALSNSLGLSSILKPSRAAVKATQEALGSRVGLSVSNANTVAATVKPYSAGFTGLLERLKSPTAMIKDNLRESFEEGYQFVISDANTNYYQRKFNAKSNNDAASMQEEYYNSIGKLFTTEEGINSMIMGFGGGAIQNGIKRVSNKVRGVKGGAELAAQIQKNLNTYTTTSIFNSPRQEAVTSENILREMETAAANGDILEYKNLQLEALFNWVHSGVKNNKFDARLEQLESLKGIEAEEFQTMWGVDFSDNSKKTVDAYIDAVANKAKKIKENVEKVDNAFGKNTFNKNSDPLKYAAFENYKQELAISLSQLDDYKRRVDSIKSEISSKIPAMNLDEVVELSSVEGINNTIKRFNTRIDELKNSEELASGNKDLSNTFKEEREFLERRVKEMAWATEDNKNYTQDFLGTINSIHTYYANGKSTRGNFTISELDSYNILANSKDVDLLFKEAQRVSNYYRELNGKEGYAEFERKYTKDVTDYMDNIIITNDGKVRIKEPEVAKDVEEVAKENQENLTRNLEATGTATVEELQKEINEGNIILTEGMLRKRDPNDPRATELERDEAMALVDAYNLPQYEEQESGNVLPRGASKTLAGEGTIREKAAKLADEEAAPGTQDSAEVESQNAEEDEEILTPLDRVWKNAVFKFYNFFNKINSWKNKNEDTMGELIKALTSNSKEDVIKNVTFKLEDAPKGKKAVKVPLYVKQKDGSYKKQNTDLKAGGYTYNVEVWFKNKKIGVLQEPTRLGIDGADGNFIPLGDITDAQQYAELTLNDAATYASFRSQYDAYKEAYDKVVANKGKKKVFSNAEVMALFNMEINYGRIATTKNQEFATPVSDLKLWKGSGLVYLNKDNELVILNQEELSPQEMVDLIAFIGDEKITKQLQKSGRNYFVISRLPDGRLTEKLSIVYARSSDTNLAADDVAKLFKGVESLEDISVSIPSKEHGSSKLSFIREADGSITMVLKNAKRSVRQQFSLPSSEIGAAENVEDLVDIINNALTKINNPLLRRVDMKVRSKDFMSVGINEKTSLNDIKANLKAAVSTPNIYSGFSVNFYPKGFQGAAPRTTSTPTTPPTTPPVTPPTQPTPEVPETEVRKKAKVIHDKLDKLYEGFINSGKTEQEATALSLKSLTDEERQVLNDSYDEQRAELNRQRAAATPEPTVTTLDIVPENEYTQFIDKNIVSEERLNSIADKVINREKLSPYENAMFIGKTSEVNEIIKNKATANEPLEDRIVNENLNSIILQLESKGFLTKNCD